MKAMVVLGGGGHSKELLELVKKLKIEMEFVIGTNDYISEEMIKSTKKEGKISRLLSPRRIGKKLWLISPTRCLVSLIQAFSIVRKSKSELVISSGPSIAVPIFIWAKLFGKKLIFIETISRVNSKSLSGRILEKISDDFFVQWEEMLGVYPNSKYAGNLL